MATEVATLASLQRIMAAQSQTMLATGTAIAKLRPLHLADVQLVGHAPRQRKHLLHHALPLPTVRSAAAIPSKNQQMRKLMRDHLM